MTIMIIDDDDDGRAIIQAILSAEGIDSVVASSGERALQMIEEITPDLFISDIRMPGIDGYELCKRIRSIERFRETPFLFHSAHYLSSVDKERARIVGVTDFMTKPANFAEMVALVKNLLS